MDPPSSAPPTAAASQPAELAAYADGEGGNRGRRNRVHPRNWGYTTYIDKIFSLRCFVNLVQLQVFPDAKDISESYGVLQAVIRKGLAPDGVVARGTSTRAQEKREGVLCFCIGDGSTARTATLASFLTNWHAVSVDPGLRPEWAGKEPHGVRRLRGYAARFEDVMADDGALRDILGDVLAAGRGGGRHPCWVVQSQDELAGRKKDYAAHAVAPERPPTSRLEQNYFGLASPTWLARRFLQMIGRNICEQE